MKKKGFVRGKLGEASIVDLFVGSSRSNSCYFIRISDLNSSRSTLQVSLLFKLRGYFPFDWLCNVRRLRKINC